MILYRPEIDGLRALAVMPVILFHAGFETFGGGFVGVDVFFVISGYLITSIILAEREAGIFSLKSFYERRARRILPVLFFVMLTCMPFAWLWLLPANMQDFAESLAAVSIFLSNHLFLSETGYFETDSELKPLLHTWSLAVEEQYYLFFPLFLLLVTRHAKQGFVSILTCTTLLSFGIGQWASHYEPEAAFFLLPARFWEIATGCLLAFLPKSDSRHVTQKFMFELGGMVGLFLILYAIFFYSRETPFPGVYALAPVIGTAMIIVFAIPQTIVNRILCTKTLVGIGVLSYSAYLWHQPVFAFVRHKTATDPEPRVFVILTLIVLLLSLFTYKFIEKPFRERKVLPNRTLFATICLLISLSFVIFGGVAHINEGFKDRFVGTPFAPLLEVKERGENKCKKNHSENLNFQDACVIGDQVKPTFTLLGDSHAEMLIDVFDLYGLEREIAGIVVTESNCLPLKSSDRVGYKTEEIKSCRQLRDSFFENLISNSIPGTVVISARWSLGIEQLRFDNKEGGIERGSAVSWQSPMSSKNGYKDTLSADLKETIQMILSKGKKVILIYPFPEMGWSVPEHLIKLLKKNSELLPSDGSVSYAVFKERNESAYKALDNIGEHPRLYRVYPESVFCNTSVENRCIAHLGGVPLYRDDDHLSKAGATIFFEEIKTLLE